MNQKSKSVKQKIITGYVLLFLIGAASISFLYNEIVEANSPQIDTAVKNQQLIDLSEALATLYEAESSGRNTDFISSEKGFLRYKNLIDNAIEKMRHVSQQENSLHNAKLDSIAVLLRKKKKSISKIRMLYLQYNTESSFTSVQEKLQQLRDSLRKTKKRIDFSKSHNEIEREFGEFITEVLTDSQLDSLSRAPVSDNELLGHYDRVLSELIVRDDLLKEELRQKEQDMQRENHMLSAKVQVLLRSLEEEIMNKSYEEIVQSQRSMERTTSVLLWVGIVGVCLLLAFGWIILKDLTRQQQYRDRLEALNNENASLLRSKTMLLATVTHDLQTPLGSILGFSDLMKKTPLDSTQSQYLNNIANSSEYILSLVNDLVDFSRLENNRIKIQRVAFNPKNIIESLFNTLRQNALDKDILLLYDVDPAIDVDLISDPYRVKQILTNLVANAIKFTQKGYVKIIGRKEGELLIFEVEDTGIGISEDEQNRIFEEFTQAHPDIEKQFGGTGLGLTISKRMVDLLGGRIWVSSQPGQGSVFSFSIPYIRSENQPIVTESMTLDTDFLKGKKILVIDDDKTQLLLMEALFSNYPIELLTLIDATKAISVLEEQSFDLVFSDIQMPKKSGFELIDKIRKHPNSMIKNMPVVALSGKRDISIEDFIKKGFTYFVEKPLKMERALEVMRFIFTGQNFISSQTQIEKKQEKLYDLSSLRQLLSDDEEAVQNIIRIFISSTQTGILEFRSQIKDPEMLAQTAHRMIPMLKQIESLQLAQLLERIEKSEVPVEQLETYMNDVVLQLSELIKILQERELPGLEEIT